VVAAHDPDAALDALIDVVVAAYAPLTSPSLGHLASLLCGGVPQWRPQRAAALARARARLPGVEVDGQRWVWPAGENPRSRRHHAADDDTVRLLAPFDPIVWDRRRFEQLWGWAYRFEAYTPAARRERGHYALPLLWRGHVIGWANVAVAAGRLMPQIGHVSGKPPRDAAYRAALDDELHRLHGFLGLR
jgi:uncharacterized protein YcaQ